MFFSKHDFHCILYTMFRNHLRKLVGYYLSGNRWWMPIGAGCLYSFTLPPFNHETHWSLSLFPLLTFVVLLPLAACATQPSLKRAALHTYLYGVTAALGQYHWLLFDNVEGLWHLVIIGLFLLSAVIGLLYLAAGLLFRIVVRSLPKAYVLVFPAAWVVIDYCRTVGDLAFPWAFLGYAMTPVLPFAQLASVTGVWGLTFIIVMGNMLLWKLLRHSYLGISCKTPLRFLAAFAAAILAVNAAGWYRICRYAHAPHQMLKISLLQANIDQFHWSNDMLDTAFRVSESLMVKSAEEKPAVMILPESALLCYITHRPIYKERLAAIILRVRIPLIFGSLDWELAPSESYDTYYVYNTAFAADAGMADFKPYHKIKLVPFSEAIPFERMFPILSRVNLGEADFHRGHEQTVFPIGKNLTAAPFICYESIFPDFVRRRVRNRANLIVNITNDGWFGRSSGPYQHAMMARMRSIENGVSLARCANSGISMFVDPVGMRYGQTELYTRAILTRCVPVDILPTFYAKSGDWFPAVCFIIIAVAVIPAVRTRRRD
jgi:apolipoprotein N-acyltransferase